MEKFRRHSAVNTIIFVASIVLVSNYARCAEALETHARRYNFSASNSTTIFYNIHRTTVSYIVCADHQLPSSNPEKRCSVVLETFNMYNDVTYEESCELTLRMNQTVKSSHLDIHRLDERKVVLNWLDQQLNNTTHLLNLMVVDFSNCTVHTSSRSVSLYEYNIFISDGDSKIKVTPNAVNFDLVYLDDKYKLHKLIFDGRNCSEVGAIQHWLPQLTQGDFLSVEPLFGFIGKNDDLVVVSNENYTDVSLYFDNTSPINLMRFQNQSLLTSTSNSMITICSSPQFMFEWKSVNCSQFDFDITEVMETSLVFGYTAEKVLVYNPAQRGVHLVISKRDTKKPATHYSFSVNKITSDKRVFRTMRITGSECSGDDVEIKEFYEDGRGKYCLTLYCWRGGDNFIIKCFPDGLLLPVSRKSSEIQ